MRGVIQSPWIRTIVSASAMLSVVMSLPSGPGQAGSHAWHKGSYEDPVGYRQGVCSRGSPLAMGPRLQLEVTRVGHGFESWRSFATVTSTAAVTAKSTNMIGARIHI